MMCRRFRSLRRKPHGPRASWNCTHRVARLPPRKENAMSDLALIQDAFSRALRDAAHPTPVSVRGPARRSADRRFAVYRNNRSAGLIAALAARFPVVQRLVGDEFFREMARQYIAHDPPRSPILMEYGETFA